MAFATLSTLDKLLKLVYIDKVRGQYYTATPVFTRIKKKAEDHHFSGRNAIVAVRYQRSEAVGARAENADLPTPQYVRHENLTIPCRYVYGAIKITGQAISIARSPGAFAAALDEEMSGIRESLMFDLSRQTVYGDGTGKIAQANGAGAGSASLTVDNPGADHLQVGMLIDIYTSSGTLEVNSIEITAVNKSTNVATLASVQTWGDNSFVYREDARNVELMGLAGILDDGTRVATFQGLSRTTYPWLKANVLSNSGTNRPLTLRLVDNLAIEAAKNGPGGYPTALYSRHTMAQDYADLVRTDRRYSPKDMTLDGGWRAIEVTHPGGTAPLILDRNVRKNEMWAVAEPTLMWFEAEPVGWMDRDGRALSRALDGTDAYEAVLFSYAELACDQPNKSTVLKDITES